MLSTLFYIPGRVAGIPVFGIGLLLAVWALISVALLAYLAWRQGFNADTASHVPLLLIIGAAIGWLLPKLCEPAGLPIRSYGVMLLAAVMAGTALAVRRARRVGVDSETVFSVVLWMCLPGIVGARAFYVVEYWPAFHKETLGETLGAVVNVAQGGLVVYGALLGGLLGLLAFAYKYHLPLLALGDLLAPSMVLGLAFGRIGCLLNGCCYGGPSQLPWAVTFPFNSPAHVHQVGHGQVFLHGLKLAGNPSDPPVIAGVQAGTQAAEAGLVPRQQIDSINGQPVGTVEEAEFLLLHLDQPGTEISIITAGARAPARWTLAGPVPRSLPVHPTQIYGAINALVLCLLLLAYDPLRRRDGETLALMLTIYPITRFLLEILRTDEAPVFGTRMSISQNVSLLALIAVTGLWFYILSQPHGRVFGSGAS